MHHPGARPFPVCLPSTPRLTHYRLFISLTAPVTFRVHAGGRTRLLPCPAFPAGHNGCAVHHGSLCPEQSSQDQHGQGPGHPHFAEPVCCRDYDRSGPCDLAAFIQASGAHCRDLLRYVCDWHSRPCPATLAPWCGYKKSVEGHAPTKACLHLARQCLGLMPWQCLAIACLQHHAGLFCCEICCGGRS